MLKKRDAILQLFLHLYEPGQQNQHRSQKPLPKFKKVAPFLVQDRLQSTPYSQGLSNGESSSNGNAGDQTSYLSSIHDIRHQMTGYHPPLPPKPKSPLSLVQKSRSSGDVPTNQGEQSATLVQHNSVQSGCDKELLRELIYSFQGIEGSVIRRSHKDDCYVISEHHRKNYPASVIQIVCRLAELGWLFNQIDKFCQGLVENSEVGLVGQSLVTALKQELAEYYSLLANIESQLQPDSGFCQLSLVHLSVWTLEPLNHMKLLASIVQACENQKGGALISKIYSYLEHGDESSSRTVHTLLCTVCKPMYLMLLRWICDGTLDDPYNEFFIASDPKVNGDRLWHEKYSVRASMIPKFLSLSWVKKILATGKSINFLHEVCHDNSAISGRDLVKASLNETSPENLFCHQGSDNLLLKTIQRAFTETSAHVLSILFTRYKFLEHISAMRKYLLLGQGDIIRYLLQLLEDVLSQPASTLYVHNLAGILETAIRATNTQFEDPDILERLDVRLLQVQTGDTGWDVFSLDYKVAGPIGTVFGPDTMNRYLMLFNALWRAKRIEWMLSCAWKQQAGLHKMCKTVPELKPLLHIANLLASEMIHFIHQLAYYITFEVMECSWDILIKQLRKAESLDEVIEAHEEFLLTLLRQSLLDERSSELLTQLRAIYDRIIEFKGIQDKLYMAGVGELEARAADEMRLRMRERKGHYGNSVAEEETQKERIRTFNKIILQNLKSQLKIVSQSYQDMVRTFLLQLACSQDQALQFLSFRLDFNQHYKRKDARLGTPLTFQHRRESMLTASFHV